MEARGLSFSLLILEEQAPPGAAVAVNGLLEPGGPGLTIRCGGAESVLMVVFSPGVNPGVALHRLHVSRVLLLGLMVGLSVAPFLIRYF